MQSRLTVIRLDNTLLCNMTRVEICRHVARAIRQRRASRDMTSLALSIRVGIPAAHMSRIESGRRMPTIHTLHRVALALEIPLVQLLEGL